MHPTMMTITAFVGVSSLIGGIMLLFRGKSGTRTEDRLDRLAGITTPAAKSESRLKPASILAAPLDAMPGFIDAIVSRFGNIDLIFQQADTRLTISKLFIISAALALLGAAFGIILRIHTALVPVLSLFLAVVPIFWVLHRRKRRLKHFSQQLPDALDTLARSLRAGQSLASGISSIASEIPAPLGKEFERIFEEQNLGIPLEEALESLTERVPNLDLKFFVTAVILQRQTGGDLAEILDKIGGLTRERFQIWGQIQALTGEGRLSGIVLLALPVVLFLAVYQLNPEYVMLLFTDPMGKKMLITAIFLQVLGALVIRKIVNIKV
jgi:tight adherence protein B